MLDLSLAQGGQGAAPRPEGAFSRPPVGQLIFVGDGEVKVNGWPAPWGSTVFEGSDIVTTSSVAFVKLVDRNAVVMIEPSGQVKIFRRGNRTVVRVIRGKVAVRSRQAFDIETPERTIRSPGEELYSVVVSDKDEVGVEAVKPSSDALARMLVLAAPTLAGAGLVQLLLGSSPGTARRLATSEEQQRVIIDCRAENLPGLGLRVVGRVERGFIPIAGAPVIVRVMFRSRLMAPLVSHLLTATTGPQRGFYQTILPASPTDLSGGGVVEVVTQVDQEVARNRCLF